MTSARILRESGSLDDVARLDRAWAAPETFAFLPEKSAVDDAWVEAALAGLPDELRRDHFALLTSGSTGQPKLVVGSRARARRLARVLHDVQDSDAVEEAILTLPLSYCYSFVNQWLWAREMGRRLVPTRGFADPGLLRETLERAQSAMLCLVGAQVGLFAAHLPDEVFPGVARVHFAGGPFPQAELASLRRRFPSAAVFNNYGCAEAMPRLTVRRAEEGSRAADVGRPLEGVELDTTEAGELRFRSPYAAVAFVDEGGVRVCEPGAWIPTGDLARRGPDGAWELLGRAGQVFKRYGEKVSVARLLETVARAWSGAAEVYREADRMGEPGACLLLAPEPSEEDVRAILKSLRAELPRAHWPLRLESVDGLPTLANGKVDLASLSTLEGKRVHWRNRI